MPPKTPHILINDELVYLIESLKNAEMSRDLTTFEKFLKPYLGSDLTKLDIFEQAYLNRFLGFFCLHFGQAKNITGYQETGKDYLTKAITLFEECELEAEAVEAEISLGAAYYHLGDTANFEPFLLNALTRSFDSEETYLSIQVSLLIVYYREKRIEEAASLIEEIETKIANCKNGRIVWQFYHNAGLAFRAGDENLLAVEYYEKAITIAKEIKNLRFECSTYNCLAFAYLKAKLLDYALLFSNKSIQICDELADDGIKADCLDTKAVILFRKGELEEALNTIIKAIAYFREGEKYLKFAEALWNKIEILNELRRKDSIVETFAELMSLPWEILGIDKRRNYLRKFANLIIIPFGESYEEKIEVCGKEIVLPVVNALRKTRAAQKLKFKNHQSLSNLMKRWGIEDENPKRADAHDIRQISFQSNFVFPNLIDLQNVAFYHCSQEISHPFFNTKNELILLVTQKGKGRDGDKILLKSSHPYITEIVEEKDAFQFINEFGITVDEDYRVLGKIIGYGEKDKNEKIIFKML